MGQQETIRRYVVPKERVAEVAGGTEQLVAERPQGPATHRMLAAIVPMEDQAWFFKLVGPIDDVEALTVPFRSFVESIDFPGNPPGDPEWELPKEWTQTSGSGMRFATIRVPGKQKDIELTVIPLPISGDQAAYLVSNINRWRADQLQLPPIRADELDEVTTQIDLRLVKATLIDFKGHFRDGGMRNAPFAGRGMPPNHPPTSAPAKPNFKAPSEWTPGDLFATRGGITLRYDAAFSVEQEDQKVEITVSRFPTVNALANVNRWRDQLGLKRLTTDQLEQERQQIPVGDGKGDYFQLISDNGDNSQAILAVIAQRPSGAWFFKLMGDRELALQEKDRFEDFVTSVSFATPES